MIVQVKNAEKLVPKKQTIKLERVRVGNKWMRVKEIRKDEIELEEEND